jgi:SET domain-containing protein
VFSEKDTEIVNKTDLQYYKFKYNDKQDCLVLGDAELFNHSPDPNVGYKLINFDGRKIMAFYALKPIPEYTQLFIDYNGDTDVRFHEYLNKNMVG